MNTVFLADFQHLLGEKELINASDFWNGLIKSRIDINQKYGESLLRWSSDVRNKVDIMSQSEDACVVSQQFRHFLFSYISSTELEAYKTISMGQNLGVNGSVQSLKKMTSSKHKNLSYELESLTKQHTECVKTLQQIKEKGLKAIAASSSYELRISELKEKLNILKNNEKCQKSIKAKIRSLEQKLRQKTESERFHESQFESLIKEEQDLIKRLRNTSDLACQQACDLQEGQIESLISVLRDLVLKTDPLSSDISDRTRPLLEILDDISVNRNDVINKTIDFNSRCYIFPDVQAWHENLGFVERLPTPFIRCSERDISQDPRKGLSVEMIMARELMSALGQTVPRRQPWISKSYQLITTGDSNNNTAVAITQAPVLDDVRSLDDVYVRAIRSFKPTHPDHLKLKPGMLLKQKFPADARGMSFGWCRRRFGGPKTYGFYPSDHVILDI